MTGGISLDPRIRDFVLLPIFGVVLMTSCLRSNLLQIFKSDPKIDMKDVKQNNMLGRCRTLRTNAHCVASRVFQKRRAYFVKKDVGVLVVNPPKAKDPMEALSAGGGDPMAMMGMMKNQMVFILLQGLTGYWVSHLFSGFLVAKTPFPLTFQFKAMLQRGVDVQALEPGYVSSLCWYMFVMFSSYPIIGLVSAFFGNQEEAGDNPMMAMMGSMGGGGMAPGGGPDMAKVYKQEQEALDMISHEYLLENIETELLRKWRQESH